MKKIYRSVLLLTVFIFLSTYNPKNLNSISEKNHILFKIQKIEILNNFLVEKREIEKKLSKIYNKNIFLVKRSDIEEPLKKIDFLEKIEVKKKYPDTIIVKIFETKPVAIIFKNKVKYLLDTSSNLVLFKDDKNFNQLPEVFGKESGELLVLSWGGVYGSVKSAVKKSQELGKSVSHIHLRYINPFPKNLGKILKKFNKILIPELNLGQLLTIIRAKYLVDAVGFNQVAGKPFSSSTVFNKIESLLKEK